MYSLYLPLALVATFAATGLAVFAVDLARADRRRTMGILETQVRPTPQEFTRDNSNLREQELSRSFSDRLLTPGLGSLNGVVNRLTPKGAFDAINRRLILAGSPRGWTAEKVAALKVVGAIAGGALGAYAAVTLGKSGATAFVLGALLAVGGYLYPDVLLTHRVDARQGSIRKALPDTMDLLTISVEAGLSFDAAMAQVVSNVPGPLSQEIARMLQEMGLGVLRVDAFRHLAKRTDVQELNGFVLAMIQADVFGVSVSKVLRAQAKEMRTRRRQRAEEAGMQLPVKLIFPTILCIMPALFVVVLGPGIIRVFHNLFGVGGPF